MSYVVLTPSFLTFLTFTSSFGIIGGGTDQKLSFYATKFLIHELEEGWFSTASARS